MQTTQKIYYTYQPYWRLYFVNGILDIYIKHHAMLCNGEKSTFSKDSFQKNPPEVTLILYMESNRH
jgi:hypothetical protein